MAVKVVYTKLHPSVSTQFISLNFRMFRLPVQRAGDAFSEYVGGSVQVQQAFDHCPFAASPAGRWKPQRVLYSSGLLQTQIYYLLLQRHGLRFSKWKKCWLVQQIGKKK